MTEHECKSRYDLGGGLILTCVQHLGYPGRERHSARQWGFRLYWTDAEAMKETDND